LQHLAHGAYFRQQCRSMYQLCRDFRHSDELQTALQTDFRWSSLSNLLYDWVEKTPAQIAQEATQQQIALFFGYLSQPSEVLLRLRQYLRVCPQSTWLLFWEALLEMALEDQPEVALKKAQAQAAILTQFEETQAAIYPHLCQWAMQIPAARRAFIAQLWLSFFPQNAQDLYQKWNDDYSLCLLLDAQSAKLEALTQTFIQKHP
jgi:hypothetical protein